jgi:hypothetical protein
MLTKELILEYRRDLTAKNYGSSLLPIIKQQGLDDVEIALEKIESMDPTYNKQYSEWLVRQFIKGQYRLEDQERVFSVLSSFNSLKQRLPIIQRDIQKYDFYGLNDWFDRVHNIKIGSRSDTVRNNYLSVPESKILYNGPLGTLLIPETIKASKILGKGTRWCTTKAENFNYYNNRGPLYIWIDKNGEKFQIHFETRQFKDSSDRELTDDLKNQLFNNPVLKQLLLEKNSIPVEWIKYLDKKHKTQKYLEAVIENDVNILSIPDELITKEMWVEAIKQNGSLLEYVPKNLRTIDLCMIAVTTSDIWRPALRSVPEEFKSKELCMSAVKQNGESLAYVPIELRTKEMCVAAVKTDWKAVQYVPPTTENKDIFKYVVQKDATGIKLIPVKKKSKELYMLAVQSFGESLEHVPEEFKSKELCMTAVKQNGIALMYVPEKFKTEELCLIAVKKFGLVLNWVPEEFKSKELCMTAVKQNGESLAYVPKRYKTEKMCILAVRNNPRSIVSVPNTKDMPFRTKQLCIEAIKKDASAYLNAPINLRKDNSFIFSAVTENVEVVKYISSDILTPQFCMRLIKLNPKSLMYIPKYKRTAELCSTAVSMDINLLDHVPHEIFFDLSF